MVPNLSTALVGPLLHLEQVMLENYSAIERWFRMEWMEHTPPFYCSVDIRNAGFKVAPVDANLFPGGFNNLANEVLPLAVQASMAAIEKICPDARNLLLIPEKHTRNTFYLENVAKLTHVLRMAGLNVRVGTLNPEIESVTRIDLPNGQFVVLEPVSRSTGVSQRIYLEGFDPCSILLNNDLSGGVPDILQNLHEQHVLPPLHAGWHQRTKGFHFQCYDEVIKKFCKLIDIDPWLLNPYFTTCDGLDFHDRVGEEALKESVSMILKKTKKKYREYGIEQNPYVVVKANAGTYGMGVMTVKDPNEVVGLNRKERNKMSVVKEGLSVESVIVQEGVQTIEKVEESVAEPVVYMIDRYVVGGFYRVHTNKGVNENLNAPGMHFVPLAFERSVLPENLGKTEAESVPNRFYLYGVVGRLALLASSLELERSAAEEG